MGWVDELAGHARRRWRLLVAAMLAFATFGGVGAALPVCDEATVRAALSAAAGVDVAAGDYVWLASQGRVDDLLRGRRVAFLGAASGSPRDVYWSRARVTPSGRLLSVGPITRVTWTTEADERDLTADSDHFAWASFVGDHCSSVGVTRAAAPDTIRTIAMVESGTELRFELQAGGHLVAQAGGAARGFAVDLGSGALLGGGPVAMVERARTLREIQPAVPIAPGPGGDDVAFSDEVVLVKDGEPAVRHGKVGDVEVLRLDPRQLDFALVPGRDAEWPNGSVPDAGLRDAPRGKAVAVLSFDVAGGGAVGADALGALTEGKIAMAADREGRLFFGPFAMAESGAFSAQVQWSSRADAGGNIVCVDAEGGLLVAWSPSAAPAADSLGCASGAALGGPLRAAQWGADTALTEPFAATSLVAFPHSWGPRLAPPAGAEWRVAAPPLPRPGFIPAVHVASTRLFETDVEVTRFDLARFDLRIVAGTAEKAHRLGGEFQRALAEDDKARALFSVSLGVGKRKRPRGLKVAGSLGHKFSRKEGILAVGAATARVGEGGAYDAESEPLDATELPLSIARGQLARPARERGPVQRRVDLCVLGGELLLAEAEFDSHEATAETLLRLGCENAVALDRGSEPPIRLEHGTPPAALGETRLIVLERPFSRRVLTDRTAAASEP